MYDAPHLPRLTLDTLLAGANIDPGEVVVLRHGPQEAAFRRVLPWLTAERPDLFNFYQGVQNGTLARSMAAARYIASFLGMGRGTATFAGLFAVGESRPLSVEGFWALPGAAELKALGLRGVGVDEETPAGLALIDLEPLPAWENWIGKLVVDWPPPERSWWRRAERNLIPIRSIAEESLFVAGMPDWTELVLTWEQLKLLPTPWRARLAEWRGVYFIFDTRRRVGYVGSACGAENIMGRWLAYGQTGHGDNQRLRASKPEDLRFSILQRTSPDMVAADIVAIETAWKTRLHTREFGLNAN